MGRSVDAVEATHLDFEHNYNARSRETMYAFFNKHLELGHEPAALVERDFQPMSPAELTVWQGPGAGVAPTASEETELSIVRGIAADQAMQWAGLSTAAQLHHARQAYRVMLATDDLVGTCSVKRCLHTTLYTK